MHIIKIFKVFESLKIGYVIKLIFIIYIRSAPDFVNLWGKPIFFTKSNVHNIRIDKNKTKFFYLNKYHILLYIWCRSNFLWFRQKPLVSWGRVLLVALIHCWQSPLMLNSLLWNFLDRSRSDDKFIFDRFWK